MTARKLLSALAVAALFVIPVRALAQPPHAQLVWNHHGYHWQCDADGDDCRWVRNAWSYHRQCDADGDDCTWIPNASNGYHRQCDRDGDDCTWVPNTTIRQWHYACDADGDDCHWERAASPWY